MSENRYVRTLCALGAGAFLVSGTLLLLQWTTTGESPPVSTEEPAASEYSSGQSHSHAPVELTAPLSPARESAPPSEPTFPSSPTAEPVYTASTAGKAESASGTSAPLLHPEKETRPSHRDTFSAGVADDRTGAAEPREVPPAQKPYGEVSTQSPGAVAGAAAEVGVSEPAQPTADNAQGDLDQGPAGTEKARSDGSSASSSQAPAAAPLATKEKPARKRVAQAEKQETAVPSSDKPHWKPMTLAPNEKLTQRLSAAKQSVKSYNSRIWAALARHKPRDGRRGSASVTFGIAANGQLRFVRVSGSSGDSRLDKLAIATVRKAAPFPPPPAGSPSYTIRIYVR